MARGKTGMKYGLSFIRTQTPEFQPDHMEPSSIDPIEVDLQLDFESNEVFDIGYIKSWIYIDQDSFDPSTEAGFMLRLGVSELPNFERNLMTETVVETDPSLIYLHQWNLLFEKQNTDTDFLAVVADVDMMKFPDWYTVGDNITIAMSGQEEAATATEFTALVEIFGRRRRASDREFRTLMNQLRR